MEVDLEMGLECLAQSVMPPANAVHGQFKPEKAFAKSA
jgi:hypothetical protein